LPGYDGGTDSTSRYGGELLRMRRRDAGMAQIDKAATVL
jgi:hypothetical protein